MPRARAPLLVLLAAACFVDHGVPESTGDPASTGSTDAATTTTTTTTTGDPTTADTTESTATTGVPGVEFLIHADPRTCDQPLWCYSGDPLMGAPGRVWAQECFESALTGPLTLDEIHYVVAALVDVPDASEQHLEVYSWTSVGPAARLAVQPLTSADLTLGDHVLRLDPPVVVDGPRFCVGLAVGSEDPMDTYAVGLAVEASAETPAGQSYVKIAAPTGCAVQNFVDAADLEAAAGTWCIGVRVLGSR